MVAPHLLLGPRGAAGESPTQVSVMQSVRLATLLVFGVAGVIGPMATPVEAQKWLAFRGSLGHEWLSGDIADPLNGDTRTEWTVFYVSPRVVLPVHLRVGAGISRVTYDVNPSWQNPGPADVAIHVEPNPPPYEHWNHVRWHVLVGAEWSAPWFDVYVERRIVWGRLRSQTQLTQPSSDDPVRVTPYDEWDSSASENVVGLKTNLMGVLPFHIDILLRKGDLEPRNLPDFDLTDHGLGPRTGGSTLGLQVGVFWNP